MKKIILLTLFVFIAVFNVKAQSDVYYTSTDTGVIIEPILYLEPSNNFLKMRASNNHNEIDYIGYNTSNVNVLYLENTVYISWNVCDDSSKSLYIVKKTTDNVNYSVVGYIENIPCTPHIPLLYNLEDKNIVLDKSYFYKLYKVLDNGSTIHIITLILPKQKNLNVISSN